MYNNDITTSSYHTVHNYYYNNNDDEGEDDDDDDAVATAKYMLDNALSSDFMIPTLPSSSYQLLKSSTTNTPIVTDLVYDLDIDDYDYDIKKKKKKKSDSTGSNSMNNDDDDDRYYQHHQNDNDYDDDFIDDSSKCGRRGGAGGGSSRKIPKKKKWWWYPKSVSNCRNWLATVPRSSSSGGDGDGYDIISSNRVLAVDPTQRDGLSLLDITMMPTYQQQQQQQQQQGEEDEGHRRSSSSSFARGYRDREWRVSSRVRRVNIKGSSDGNGHVVGRQRLPRPSIITEVKCQVLGPDDQYAFISTTNSFHITSIKNTNGGEIRRKGSMSDDDEQEQEEEEVEGSLIIPPPPSSSPYSKRASSSSSYPTTNTTSSSSSSCKISECRGIDVSRVFPATAAVVTPTSLLQYDPHKDSLIQIFTLGNKDNNTANNGNNRKVVIIASNGGVLNSILSDNSGTIRSPSSSSSPPPPPPPLFYPTPQSSMSLSSANDDDDSVASSPSSAASEQEEQEQVVGNLDNHRRFTGVAYSYLHPSVLFLGGIRLSMVDMRTPTYPKVRTMNNTQPLPYHVGITQNWDVDEIYYWTALCTLGPSSPYQLAAASRRHACVSIMDIRGGHNSRGGCGCGSNIIAEWPLATRHNLWLSMIYQDAAGLPSCTSLQYIPNNRGDGGGGKILSFIPSHNTSSLACVNYNNSNGMFSRPTHLFYDERKNNGLAGAASCCSSLLSNDDDDGVAIAALDWRGHIMLASPTTQKTNSKKEKKSMIDGSSSSSCMMPLVKSKAIKPISCRVRDWAPQLVHDIPSIHPSEEKEISSRCHRDVMSSSPMHYTDGGPEQQEQQQKKTEKAEYGSIDSISHYVKSDRHLIIILTALGLIHPKASICGVVGTYSWKHHLHYLPLLSSSSCGNVLLSSIQQTSTLVHSSSCRAAILEGLSNYQWLQLAGSEDDDDDDQTTTTTTTASCLSKGGGMRYWDYLHLFRDSTVVSTGYDKNCEYPLDRYELLSVLKCMAKAKLITIEYSQSYPDGGEGESLDGGSEYNNTDWIAFPNDDLFTHVSSSSSLSQDVTSTSNEVISAQVDNDDGRNRASRTSLDVKTIQKLMDKWEEDDGVEDDGATGSNNNSKTKSKRRAKRYIKLV